MRKTRSKFLRKEALILFQALSAYRTDITLRKIYQNLKKRWTRGHVK